MKLDGFTKISNERRISLHFHCKIREAGWFKPRKSDSVRHRTDLTRNIEEAIFEAIDSNPRVSTRRINRALGVNHV